MLASLAPASASADDNPDLDRARELEAALDYREAYEALAAALARGDSAPKDVAAMHRLGGQLAAGLGEADQAARHFENYLALDPDGELPEGASPKLTDPFIAARSELRGRRLAATHVVTGSSLEVTVQDPSNMVHAIRVALYGPGVLPGETRRIEDEPPYRVTLPPTRPLRFTITILDKHDNLLLELGSEGSPIEIGGAGSRRRAATRPLTWAIASGASGAAALAFGLLARRAQSDLDGLSQRAIDEPFTVSFDDFKDVEARGDRWALATNISLAVAGLSGFAAVALWLSQRGDDEEVITPTASASPEAFTIGARARF